MTQLDNNCDIIQSVDALFDRQDNKMSVHTREKDGRTQVIINRSCEKCTDFHQIPSGDWLCTKCTYRRYWLENGMI